MVIIFQGGRDGRKGGCGESIAQPPPAWPCGLCTRRCTETAPPGGQSLPCAGGNATPSALTPDGRAALVRGALCLLGWLPLLASPASHLSDHDFSAAFAPPSGCSDTLSGSSTLPGKSGTEARTQTHENEGRTRSKTSQSTWSQGPVSDAAVLP